METSFKIKRFNELSLDDLYKILSLRSEVFVVEQNCVYQDVDGKDSNAIHILGYQNEELVAYARIFDKRAYFEEASIGRVVVKQNKRALQLGHLLMKQAIKAIQECFYTEAIVISAQKYLKKFYESHGFIQISDMYLEDGIPHIRMKRT